MTRTDLISPVMDFITPSEPVRTSQADLKWFCLFFGLEYPPSFLLYTSSSSGLQPQELSRPPLIKPLKPEARLSFFASTQNLKSSFAAPSHLTWTRTIHVPILPQGLQCNTSHQALYTPHKAEHSLDYFFPWPELLFM